MDRKKFEEIVRSVPELVDSGIATRSFCRFFKLSYPQPKDSLLSDEGFATFERCVAWLHDNCIPTKTIGTRSPTSRTLQQIAKKSEYVSNGAMIAAIIYVGFPYKIGIESPNIQVGVSRRSPCFKQ